jgi:hypothetical protein
MTSRQDIHNTVTSCQARTADGHHSSMENNYRFISNEVLCVVGPMLQDSAFSREGYNFGESDFVAENEQLERMSLSFVNPPIFSRLASRFRGTQYCPKRLQKSCLHLGRPGLPTPFPFVSQIVLNQFLCLTHRRE